MRSELALQTKKFKNLSTIKASKSVEHLEMLHNTRIYQMNDLGFNICDIRASSSATIYDRIFYETNSQSKSEMEISVTDCRATGCLSYEFLLDKLEEALT